MQPEPAPAGYAARVPVPINDPPYAGEPVNGRVDVPRPRPSVEGVDLTRVSRWVLEQGLDALGEPVRFSADEQYHIVTVTLAEIDHVVAWAHRFKAGQPARLPADRHIGHPIVQAHIVREGWTIVFRCVEDGR